MSLVCDSCNHLRASEDKLIGVVLVCPSVCAVCRAALTQQTACKVDESDLPVIRERRARELPGLVGEPYVDSYDGER